MRTDELLNRRRSMWIVLIALGLGMSLRTAEAGTAARFETGLWFTSPGGGANLQIRRIGLPVSANWRERVVAMEGDSLKVPLEPGAYSLRVTFGSAQPIGLVAPLVVKQGVWTPVRLEAPPPSCRMNVEVRDEEGHPVKGSRVRALSVSAWSLGSAVLEEIQHAPGMGADAAIERDLALLTAGFSTWCEVDTDAEGKAELVSLPRNLGLQFAVEASGYSTWIEPEIWTAMGEMPVLRVVLQRSRPARKVRVALPNGDPAVGAWVACSDWRQFWPPGGEGLMVVGPSDEFGNMTIYDPPPGEFEVTAFGRGWVRSTTSALTADRVFRLREGFELVVEVGSRQGGQALPDAVLSAMVEGFPAPLTIESSGHGLFRLQGELWGGANLRLWIQAPGFVAAEASLQRLGDTESPLRIELQPAPSTVVEVRAPKGAPYAFKPNVSCWEERTRLQRPPIETTQTGAGQWAFSFGGLAPGRYKASVYSPGQSQVVEFQVGEDPVREVVLLEVGPLAPVNLVGRVVSPDGKPLQGAEVIYGQGSAAVASLPVSPQGQFDIWVPGTLDGVEVRCPGYGRARLNLLAEEQVITMQPEGRIVVRLRDEARSLHPISLHALKPEDGEESKPMRGVRWHEYMRAERVAPVYPTWSSSHVFSELPPGEYRVSLGGVLVAGQEWTPPVHLPVVRVEAGMEVIQTWPSEQR